MVFLDRLDHRPSYKTFTNDNYVSNYIVSRDLPPINRAIGRLVKSDIEGVGHEAPG